MKNWYSIIIALLLGIIAYNEFSREDKQVMVSVVKQSPHKLNKKHKSNYLGNMRSEAHQDISQEAEIRYEKLLKLKYTADLAMFEKLAPRYDVEILFVVTGIHVVKILYRSEDLLEELFSLLPGIQPIQNNPKFKFPPPLKAPVDKGFHRGLTSWYKLEPDDKAGDKIIIAVLDSGVIDLPQFKNKVTHIDLIKDGSTITHNHGTAVASVILGGTKKVKGFAPAATILDIRVMSNAGIGDGLTIAQGIVTATDLGASVINLSIGSPDPSPILAAAIEYAFAANVIIVAAVGNEGADKVSFPAAYDGVIGVAAIDEFGNHQTFSNKGEQVDMAAPGLSVPVLGLNGEELLKSGTSFSCPQVAGAIADLLSHPSDYGGLDPIQIVTKNLNDAGAPGNDTLYGDGILNLERIKQDDGVYDLAVSGCNLKAQSGYYELTVSGENRGSRMIKSAQMTVRINQKTQQFYFRNIAISETFYETIQLSSPQSSNPITINVSVKADFIDDVRPDNNNKKFSISQ